jgi:hypothetical protein
MPFRKMAHSACALETVGPLYHGPDDVMFVRDQNGDAWTTGWANGVLYKRRLRGL